MGGLVDRLLAGEPAGWVRRIEVTLLMDAFARAFGVEPPVLRGARADEALATYRSFTATCMEMALEDEALARHLRLRLGEEARLLGGRVCRLVPLPASRMADLARYLYRGIGIGIEGDLPGSLRFAPCSFAERYTPGDCWLMSAFDEGFLQGLMGDGCARLTFGCRLSEGAACCEARFMRMDADEEA